MNAETVALIEKSQGWRELALAAEAGRLPQSVGVSLPSVMHGAFAEMYGRLVLGDDGLWTEGAQPDMISAGGANAAPTIEECRRLQGELALHPLSAKRRLAVVWSVERGQARGRGVEQPAQNNGGAAGPRLHPFYIGRK